MNLESIPDTFEYPAGKECQVNAGKCRFEVDYLCHECGRQLCANCAIGVNHQPQLFKYVGLNSSSDERTQAHCPDCTAGHDWNTTVLGLAGGGVLLGLILLLLGGTDTLAVTFIGLVLVTLGGIFGYNEYGLKKERDLSVRE